MLVQDVMTRAVATARPETPLQEVASGMCLNRISGMPVLGDNDELKGFVAERDILHRMFPRLEELLESGSGTQDFQLMEGQYREVMGLRVEEVMTRGVISVRPDFPLLKAISVMVRHKLRRVPVADENGRLLGIISIGDVHKALFRTNMKLAS